MLKLVFWLRVRADILKQFEVSVSGSDRVE
jgi:hypothetical protein